MSWYEKGLRFKCTGCGKCCTGSPGYVWVTKDEIDLMAKELDITPVEFTKKYTRYVNGYYSLLEDSTTYDCIFLKENKCALYHSRPKQCRTYPWWRDNLSSKRSWKQAAKLCEGIEHEDAPVVTLSEIEDNLS